MEPTDSEDHIYPLFTRLGFPDWFDLETKLLKVKRQGGKCYCTIRTKNFEDLLQKGKHIWSIPAIEPVRVALFPDLTVIRSDDYEKLNHYDIVVLYHDGEQIECKYLNEKSNKEDGKIETEDLPAVFDYYKPKSECLLDDIQSWCQEVAETIGWRTPQAPISRYRHNYHT